MVEQRKHHNKFSKSEVIRFGWDVAKKNLWFFVAILLISNVISWLFSFVSQPLFANNNAFVKIIGILITIAGWIVSLEIGYATFVIFLKFVDKKKVAIKDLFAYFDAGILFRYLLVSLLYGLLVVIGLVLFIIPGIYLGIKYWFAIYIYVDKRTGIIESFKESAKITKGVKWQLFLLGLLQFLIMLAGALALLVGLFVAIPINYLSDFYVYRKLSAKA